MVDDPIFDPWPIEEASPAAPPPRWRSTTLREGLPLRPPSPPLREPGPPAPASTHGARARAKRLRAIALPRLEALATRLEGARHRTLLDDRLDRAEPVLRFRLRPWRAPFEVAGAVPGSVLEVAVEGARIAARFWLDPLATTPAEETLIDARRLTDAWLEGVLLDFVGRALGRL